MWPRLEKMACTSRSLLFGIILKQRFFLPVTGHAALQCEIPGKFLVTEILAKCL